MSHRYTPAAIYRLTILSFIHTGTMHGGRLTCASSSTYLPFGVLSVQLSSSDPGLQSSGQEESAPETQPARLSKAIGPLQKATRPLVSYRRKKMAAMWYEGRLLSAEQKGDDSSKPPPPSPPSH